jgi:LysM repeat protein
LTTERLFAIVGREQMYAAGYGIRPMTSRRNGGGIRSAGRLLGVMTLTLATTVALAVVAHGGSAPVTSRVVVQPGDTLWSIASARYPSDDVRVRVDDIERANGLRSPVIEVGQTLQLPG